MKEDPLFPAYTGKTFLKILKSQEVKILHSCKRYFTKEINPKYIKSLISRRIQYCAPGLAVLAICFGFHNMLFAILLSLICVAFPVVYGVGCSW
jgi:hypothetical protein